MGYSPLKRVLISVYTDDMEGKLKVKAESEDEALKKVQKLGFKVSNMIPDYGFDIKPPPRKL